MSDAVHDEIDSTDQAAAALEPGGWDRARRAFRWLLLAAFVLLACGMLREFFETAERWPYLAGDDALVNVSFSAAQGHGYGFPADPLQNPTHLPRHDRFFNYGPWYFYAGAAVIWLFDFDLLLVRAIHPIAWLALAAFALWFFRGRGTGFVGALVAVLMVYFYRTSQWPMVRPDVFVSIFLVLFLATATHSIRTGSARSWFCTAFFAAASALSHLMAWSMIPACAALFATVLILRPEARHRWARNVVACTGGGLFAAVQFFAFSGVGVGEYLGWLRDNQASLDQTSPGYFAVLWQHLDVWAYSRVTLWPLWVGVLLVGGTVAVLLSRLRPAWREAGFFELVLPALVAFVFHVLSRGTYNNYHMGYSIVLHVALCWLTGALLRSLLQLLDGFSPRAFQGVAMLGSAVVLIFALGQFGQTQDQSSTARRLAAENCPIPEFIAGVRGSLAPSTRSWGSVLFGLENPRHLQNIRFNAGVRIFEKLPPARRHALAPDAIVWGYIENLEFARDVFRGAEPRAQELPELLPGHEYDLVALVNAHPYRTTRVYMRRDPAAPPPKNPPQFRAYDPATRAWLEQSAPTSVVWEPATPEPLTTTDGPAVLATASFVAELPPGFYALSVDVKIPDAGAESGPRLVLARPPSTGAPESFTELGFDFDTCPLFPRQATAVRAESERAFLLCRHGGGPLIVSLLGLGLLQPPQVERLAPLPLKPHERVVARETLPQAAAWSCSQGVERRADSAWFEGDTTPYGYQIVSPEIPVVPGERVRLESVIEVDSGRVALGVLDAKGAWLVPAATPARSGQTLEFDFASGHNDHVRLVVANLQEPGSTTPSVFRLQPGAYQCYERANRNYVDALFDGSEEPNRE